MKDGVEYDNFVLFRVYWGALQVWDCHLCDLYVRTYVVCTHVRTYVCSVYTCMYVCIVYTCMYIRMCIHMI